MTNERVVDVARNEVPRHESPPRMSIGLLSLAVITLVGVITVHVSATLLAVAWPDKVPASWHSAAQRWLAPEFNQDWRMFAPNPEKMNRNVQARIRTINSTSEKSSVSTWHDLTNAELAGVRHNPVPSQVNQNMLRLAWLFYANSHNELDETLITPEMGWTAQYLKRIALQRLLEQYEGESIVGIQLREEDSPVSKPSWSDIDSSLRPATRLLPWWTVTEHDKIGLR